MSWQTGYVWPGNVFRRFGIGRSATVLEGVEGHIVDTRVWPALLVASLMGEFTVTKSKAGEDDNSPFDRILPSRRLMGILLWLHERKLTGLYEPEATWDAVNEACIALFGASVIESMRREVTAQRAAINRQLPPPSGRVSVPNLDILGHQRIREELLLAFEADPMRFIDPVVFWEEPKVQSPELLPGSLFVDRRGFRKIPKGLEPLLSPIYGSQVGKRPVFLKPTPPSEFEVNFEFTDEFLTACARFLLKGCLADGWIGPELPVVRDMLARNISMIVVPPYDRPVGRLVSG